MVCCGEAPPASSAGSSGTHGRVGGDQGTRMEQHSASPPHVGDWKKGTGPENGRMGLM